MANPHHQWKIRGIFPKNPKIKELNSPKWITKKAPQSSGRFQRIKIKA
jgi:hypothetical protein